MKKTTLEEMLSAIAGELRENGRWGTAHIYEATRNVFATFNRREETPMHELSPMLLKEFEMYLRHRNCSWNTVSTYMKTVRSAYNRAVDRGHADYIPRLFEHVYTGTKADRKRALEAEEMGVLIRKAEAELSQRVSSASLRRTQLLFVFMFLTRGLPFVDLAYLHKKDLQGNVLSYRRKKTGRILKVVLSPEAMNVIRLMADTNPDSPYLFPILHSKDGSEAAYREYQSALRNFNHQLSVLSRRLGINSHISTYTARHTWATMAYYCQVHPGIISEAMGHSSISVTETYLKPFCDQKIDEANRTVISFVKSDGASASTEQE